jgi:hypothetical protein
MASANRKHLWNVIRFWSFVIAVVVAIIAGILGAGAQAALNAGYAGTNSAGTNVCVTFALFAIWIGPGIALWRFLGRIVDPMVEAANQPIHSPEEIVAIFQAHYGHPPTLPDIAAIQQIERGRRNDGLLGLGIVLGSAIAVQHTLHDHH